MPCQIIALSGVESAPIALLSPLSGKLAACGHRSLTRTFIPKRVCKPLLEYIQ